LFASVIRFCRTHGGVCVQEEDQEERNRRAQRNAAVTADLPTAAHRGRSYTELLARIWAGIKPLDIIEEMLTADAAVSQWELSRYLRAKWSLIQGSALDALEHFLRRQLDYEMCVEQYVDEVVEIFQDQLPEEEADSAHALAHACAREEGDAVNKLNEILDGTERNSSTVWSGARYQKAQELVQGYARQEPDAVRLIHELLADAGMTMDDFKAEALAEKLDQIERIDRLITLTESRRNASLRELERRRATGGQEFLRGAQQAVDAKMDDIEHNPVDAGNWVTKYLLPDLAQSLNQTG
jgi:hypothetical protein